VKDPLIEMAGNPRMWVVCNGRRIAAVTADRDFVFWRSPGRAWLALRDDGLWQFYSPGNRITMTADGRQQTEWTSPPPPERVPVAQIDCREHGNHAVDGARLARYARVHRRVAVSELEPR
jgi:hypothetical protein